MAYGSGQICRFQGFKSTRCWTLATRWQRVASVYDVNCRLNNVKCRIYNILIFYIYLYFVYRMQRVAGPFQRVGNALIAQRVAQRVERFKTLAVSRVVNQLVA